MKISKTLFKNLIRCSNFPAIYDMYINRSFHKVKQFNKNEEKNIFQELDKLDKINFENDIEEEIFELLFDAETGEDLTEVKSAQLDAFQSIFVEVEKLAIEQAKKTFNRDIIASTNTYEQKYFEYSENDIVYYCYLDGYSEDDNAINVFEVKSTTSRKYDEMNLCIKKTKSFEGVKLPLFITSNDGITRFIGYDYVGLQYGEKLVTKEMIDEECKKLCNLYSDFGKNIYDLAIERNIIESSIKEKNKKINYYLIVLNYQYTKETEDNIFPRDSNGNELFKIYDFSYITEIIQPEIREKRKKLEYNLQNLQYNNHSFSESCEYKKTTQCKFFNICGKCINREGSILEYLNKSYAFIDKTNKDKKRKYISLYDLINEGYYDISSTYPYIYKVENRIQYDCYVNNKVYIDKERIKKALSLIKYPIYHLDFESYNSPLPRFIGEHPYTQSLFQYSLHVEKAPGVCDIEKNHYEFLASDHRDHRLELVESLIKNIDLSNGGTVMVYNQSFEKTRLKELSIIYPQYKKNLDKINEHIYDLYAVLSGKGSLYSHLYNKNELEVIPKFAYYSNELHGSFSIKKVLPIFTKLSYNDLNVKNGTEAILTYGLLPTLTDQEYNDKYLALRIYCRQDTWAMVEILRGLIQKIEK